MTLSKKFLYSLGIPSVFVPGLILASLLGWDYGKDLSRLALSGGLYQNETIFPKSSQVNRVVDGDTLELTSGQTVRLIGLQSPERGQLYYSEASKALEGLVSGRTVRLEYEPTDALDKYGRLVAYVYADGGMVNAQMLRLGLGKFIRYPHYRKFKYEDLLKEAEASAQLQNLGLWKTP